jgi:hypothetical protein
MGSNLFIDKINKRLIEILLYGLFGIERNIEIKPKKNERIRGIMINSICQDNAEVLIPINGKKIISSINPSILMFTLLRNVK